jgi:hypothetical protein
MSEQQQKPKSFMEELDRWSEVTIIDPLIHPSQFPEEWENTIEKVKKAIRTKVLDSYRNGQAAVPRQVKQPQTGRRV